MRYHVGDRVTGRMRVSWGWSVVRLLAELGCGIWQSHQFRRKAATQSERRRPPIEWWLGSVQVFWCFAIVHFLTLFRHKSETACVSAWNKDADGGPVPTPIDRDRNSEILDTARGILEKL